MLIVIYIFFCSVPSQSVYAAHIYPITIYYIFCIILPACIDSIYLYSLLERNIQTYLVYLYLF